MHTDLPEHDGSDESSFTNYQYYVLSKIDRNKYTTTLRTLALTFFHFRPLWAEWQEKQYNCCCEHAAQPLT